VQVLGIGVAGGVAAGLLFLSPVGGSLLALPLFFLTGLPVAIAGLGWGLVAGAVAAGVGGLAILTFVGGTAAVAFLLLFGAPIVWLSRLATLWREPSEAAGAPQWFPLGRLLLHAAAAAAAGVVLVGAVVGYEPAALVEEFTAVVSGWLAGAPTAAPLDPAEIEAIVRFNVAAMPFVGGVLMVAILVFDMWLAAIVARASGRLRRPRERLWTVVMPSAVLVVFALALVLHFATGAFAAVTAVVAGAFGCAIGLTGLAVLHALTVGIGGRGAVLAFAYLLLLVSSLPILLLGIGETFFRLRARRFRGAPPPA